MLWVEEGMNAYHVYVVRPFETALYWTSVSIERSARPVSHARLHRRLTKVAEAIRTGGRLPMERLDLDADQEPADWRSAAGDLHGARRMSAGFAFAPHGRIGFSATERIELFTTLRAEAWLRTIQYRVPVQAGGSRVAFAPHRARATPAAGLALRL